MLRLLPWLLASLLPASSASGEALDIRGAWHAESYVLKDGPRHTVRGSIVFAERDWSVVFLVTADGRTPQRGSGEGGSYTLDGNQLVFSHHHNLSGGGAVEGLPASSFEMNLHAAADAPTEPCTVELFGRRLTIRFPSGNAMTFVRADSGRPERARHEPAPIAGPPPIAGHVTFLYFNDVEAAARFYGETLGLSKTFDLGWVKIFSLSATSSVGLVDGRSGAHRPAAEKPVMLSLVVEDADRWYRYLEQRGVEIPEPPQDGTRVRVRAFGFRDPEGHTLEVFQWLER